MLVAPTLWMVSIATNVSVSVGSDITPRIKPTSVVLVDLYLNFTVVLLIGTVGSIFGDIANCEVGP